MEQALQDPTNRIALLLDEGSELLEKVQEESWRGSQTNAKGSEAGRGDRQPAENDPMENIKEEKGAEIKGEGSSAPKEIPKIYPSLTRLANLTIEDDPPRYRPLTLPKSSLTQNEPFSVQTRGKHEDWEDEEEEM